MKKQIFIFFILLFTINLFGISIYDIQYTKKAGNNKTYPSKYNGKTVTTGGIVTGINFLKNNTFFIESSSGGPWSGIYIDHSNNSVSLGDSIIITGKVYDFYGPTKINNVTKLQIISSKNKLPPPINISTNDINKYEKYESVLVTINNVKVTEESIRFGNWKVDDGSGECTISSGFVDIIKMGVPINLDRHFNSITGILNYIYNNHHINPRSTKDFSNLSKNFSSEIGDTLTIIQKPLLNIPHIGIPGDKIEILCKSDKLLNEWSAHIQFKKFKYTLKILKVDKDNNFYKLTVKIPQTNLYELFDLIVSDGKETDKTENAIKIIPKWKKDYYFIHITDSHLPTHYSYININSKTDTSEIDDLREVIKDINILNPEFVLFTGDIINDGEMEDYQSRRYYTKSQKLIAELEVPVYITSGNNDLGGWKETPPKKGTARRDWWRFYGWKWLQNKTKFYPYHTQNFHFKYGLQNYIGLEAYQNTDNYLEKIYGNTSFTNDQMKYLKTVLAKIPKQEQKILFYHYDFSRQLNLDKLGVDMALWGHVHINLVNFKKRPYNIATAATCDGMRAYRVIKVKSNKLYPQKTVSAGDNGKKLDIEYFPSNDGKNNVVKAIIKNNHSISFENILIKIKMPKSSNYEIKNGKLLQTLKYNNFNICYINTSISSSNTTTVSISAK